MNRIHKIPLVAWVGFPPVADFFIIPQTSAFNLGDSEEQAPCMTSLVDLKFLFLMAAAFGNFKFKTRLAPRELSARPRIRDSLTA